MIEAKQRAQTGIIMSVADSLIGSVSSYDDPADSWAMLKNMFGAGNQQQIMLLMSKLHNMTMEEGEEVNTYLSEAMDIRNQLRAFGEKVEDKTLNNIVLNGLPRSYEMVI